MHSSFAFLLTLLMSITLYNMGYPFGQLRSAVLAASPPNLLPTPSLLGVLERQPWCCVGLAQQPTCGCGTNTLPDASAKHSTMRSAMWSVSFKPGRPTTARKVIFPWRGKGAEKLSLQRQKIEGTVPNRHLCIEAPCGVVQRRRKTMLVTGYASAIQHLCSHILQSLQSNF